MRLIRATGQNVSPSDDGRLYDQIFTDGLFADTSFAMLGANNVQIGTIYGDLCGRDFTIEQQTVAVTLPEGEGETTGYIFVEIDTSAETPLSVGSALAPFTPTYEDINVNGAVAQMIIAEYTASAVAVTSITAKYSRVSTGGIGSLAMIESSPATANHSVGSYLVYDGVLYKVRSAIAAGETLVPGTNITATTAGAELTSLNNGLTWKYHRGLNGIGSIDISSLNFNELFIQVNIGASGNKAIYQIPKAILSSSVNWFRQGGYYNAQSNELVTISATLSTVSLVNAYINGQDLGASTNTQIFYR